jgi:hypothetical protein
MPPSCWQISVGDFLGNKRGSSAQMMHSSPGYAALHGGRDLVGTLVGAGSLVEDGPGPATAIELELEFELTVEIES